MQRIPNKVTLQRILEEDNALLEAGVSSGALKLRLTVSQSPDQKKNFIAEINNLNQFSKLRETCDTLEEVFDIMANPNNVRLNLEDRSVILVAHFGSMKTVIIAKFILTENLQEKKNSNSLQFLIEGLNSKKNLDDDDVKQSFGILIKQILLMKKQISDMKQVGMGKIQKVNQKSDVCHNLSCQFDETKQSKIHSQQNQSYENISDSKMVSNKDVKKYVSKKLKKVKKLINERFSEMQNLFMGVEELIMKVNDDKNVRDERMINRSMCKKKREDKLGRSYDKFELCSQDSRKGSSESNIWSVLSCSDNEQRKEVKQRNKQVKENQIKKAFLKVAESESQMNRIDEKDFKKKSSDKNEQNVVQNNPNKNVCSNNIFLNNSNNNNSNNNNNNNKNNIFNNSQNYNVRSSNSSMNNSCSNNVFRNDGNNNNVFTNNGNNNACSTNIFANNSSNNNTNNKNISNNNLFSVRNSNINNNNNNNNNNKSNYSCNPFSNNNNFNNNSNNNIFSNNNNNLNNNSSNNLNRANGNLFSNNNRSKSKSKSKSKGKSNCYQDPFANNPNNLFYKNSSNNNNPWTINSSNNLFSNSNSTNIFNNNAFNAASSSNPNPNNLFNKSSNNNVSNTNSNNISRNIFGRSNQNTSNSKSNLFSNEKSHQHQNNFQQKSKSKESLSLVQKLEQYENQNWSNYFKFRKNTLRKIKNKSFGSNWLQFVFFQQITFEKQFIFRVKIVSSTSNNIIIGFVDYEKQKQKESSCWTNNAVCYYGSGCYGARYGLQFPGLNKKDTGVAVGQTLEVRIDRRKSLIKWIVEGTLRGQSNVSFQGDSQREIFPYVELYEIGDEIDWSLE